MMEFLLAFDICGEIHYIDENINKNSTLYQIFNSNFGVEIGNFELYHSNILIGETTLLCNSTICNEELIVVKIFTKFELEYKEYLKNVRWLSNIPPIYHTYELCISSVKCNSSNLQFVPNQLKTTEMCEIAVRSGNIHTLDDIPKELFTENIYMIAYKSNKKSFKFLPEELKTQELSEDVIFSGIKALKYVPEHLKTAKMCEFATGNFVQEFRWVPDNFKTQNMCITCAEYVDICDISEKLVNEDLIIELLHAGNHIKNIPVEYLTRNAYKVSLKLRNDMLKYIPEEIVDQELCDYSVECRPLSFEFVGEKYKTRSICIKAISQYIYNLEYLPEKYRNDETNSILRNMSYNHQSTISEDILDRILPRD